MSYAAAAKVLLLGDDTVRTWRRLCEDDGIEGLAGFGYGGSACRLSNEQQAGLKAWINQTLLRTTREIGAWIERETGIQYRGRPGLVDLLHRLGMEHRKPKSVSRKLDPARQVAFIKTHEGLLNHRDILLLAARIPAINVNQDACPRHMDVILSARGTNA